MPGFLLDTSCMIAMLCAWHEHHEPALREVSQRTKRGDRMIAPAPALVEAYAVLTRLPPPRRLPAAAALALLDENFLRRAEVVALDANTYRDLLQRAPACGVLGGRIYDAVIVACARLAGASALLTFNERDFLPLAGRDLDIIVPV